jgi:hypothetical protein
MRQYVMIMAMAVTSVMTYAQREQDLMKRAAKQADEMKSELGLDEVQYKSVKAINEEFAIKQLELRNDSALTMKAKKELMKSLHKEKMNAINKVLTKDQSKKWAAFRHSQKQKYKTQRKKGDHALRMQKSLSLTEEQTEKVKALDQEFVNRFRSLRRDTTLTRYDFRRKVEPIRDAYVENMRGILTAEQFRKWDRQRHNRRN